MIADRDHGHRRELWRDLEFEPGAVGVETAHLMRHEAHGRGLEAQIQGRRARVILPPAVGLAGLAHHRVGAGQKHQRRAPGPGLVALGQAFIGALPGRLIPAFVKYDKTPGLIAEAGRRPAGRLDQAQHLFRCECFLRVIGAAAPAQGDHVMDGGLGVDFLLEHGGWTPVGLSGFIKWPLFSGRP